VSYLVYLRRRPELHKVSRFKSPGGALGAWVVLAFMGCMGVILAMWDDTRPGLVYSLVWIAFIVGAAFANRHYLLRRAERGVLGDGGTGEGRHQGPHLYE
jgi:D-serine/D-alanine/glycine transporter